MNIFGKGRRVWLAGAAAALSGAAVFTYFTEFSPEERAEGVRMSGATDARYAAAQPGFTLDVRRGDTPVGPGSAGMPSGTASAVLAPSHWNGDATPVLAHFTGGAEDTLPDHAVDGSGVSGEFNSAALRAPRVSIPLANGQVLEATRQRQQLGNDGSVSWVGTFADQPGSLLVMTSRKGVVTGFATHGADIYEIRPAKGGAQVLYKVDERRLPKGDIVRPVTTAADSSPDTTADTIGTTSAATGTTTGYVHDALVLYTSAAASAYGQAGIESMIQSAIAGGNQAYQNSSVGITLNLVGLQLSTLVENSSSTQTTLSSLQSSSEVQKLRDQLSADVVILVSIQSDYCGMANLMNSPSTSFAGSAYGVVAANCLSNHSLAHEIGHLQGVQHNRENASLSMGSYPYGFGFRRCTSDGTGFRDVMSYDCGVPRVAQFSNPTVLYNGYPSGIDYNSDPANAADNAQAMNNTASVVSQFRVSSSTPPASPSGLTASAASYSQVNLGWTDNATNESGYVVERSGDDVSYVEIATLGAGSTGYSDNGLSATSTYYYRVRAYNSAGNSAYSGVVSIKTPDLPPAAPSSVGATDNANGSATVSWTPGSSNATGYTVRRETYNSRKGTWGSGTTIASVSASMTTMVDSPGTGTYRYSVAATNAGGASGYAGPAPVNVTSPSVKRGRK